MVVDSVCSIGLMGQNTVRSLCVALHWEEVEVAEVDYWKAAAVQEVVVVGEAIYLKCADARREEVVAEVEAVCWKHVDA